MVRGLTKERTDSSQYNVVSANYDNIRASNVAIEIETVEYAWETSGLEIKKPNIKIADKIAVCGSVGSGVQKKKPKPVVSNGVFCVHSIFVTAAYKGALVPVNNQFILLCQVLFQGLQSADVEQLQDCMGNQRQ
ncbi:hypothetical protein V6N11_067606 [Hibiscus sabdariffa]|uniref:Uncharacterized protein n=1 Tax=Hibiscus sabdariffa TaxID=183260 RepID=A0ABR2SR81_9ROSI